MPDLPFHLVAYLAAQAARHRLPDAVSYAGIVALLVCSLSVVFTAVLLPQRPLPAAFARRRGEAWIVAVGAGLVLWAARKLAVALPPADPIQVVTALFLTEAVMAGVFVTWIADIIRERLVRMEEETLHVALLVAPLLALLIPGVFRPRLDVAAVALWFSNGVVWQLVCTRCVPTWQNALCRRVDPPDLGVLGCHDDLWQKFPRPGKG